MFHMLMSTNWMLPYSWIFSMNVPKSSTVIRKVQFRFNRVDVRVEKSILRPRTMAILKTVQPAQTTVTKRLDGMYPSIYISKFES